MYVFNGILYICNRFLYATPHLLLLFFWRGNWAVLTETQMGTISYHKWGYFMRVILHPDCVIMVTSNLSQLMSNFITSPPSMTKGAREKVVTDANTFPDNRMKIWWVFSFSQEGLNKLLALRLYAHSSQTHVSRQVQPQSQPNSASEKSCFWTAIKLPRCCRINLPLWSHMITPAPHR